MPFILLVFPALHTEAHEINDLFHSTFAILVVISASLAMYPHCKKPGNKSVITKAFLGVFLVLTGIYYGHDHSELLETVLTILGSTVLIWAHFQSMKIKHSKCEDEKSPCKAHH
jgi:purine-cytosine permease-like protein